MIQSPLLSGKADDTAREVKYHYAFFLPAADHSFFSKVKEGAIDAGKSLDCATGNLCGIK